MALRSQTMAHQKMGKPTAKPAKMTSASQPCESVAAHTFSGWALRLARRRELPQRRRSWYVVRQACLR